MNFWKKLFAGMGVVCGFLVFETMSLAYHNSSRRHKNRKGCCRRNSFWDTFTRYMIFAWSCIWASRNITFQGSCIEIAAQPQRLG